MFHEKNKKVLPINNVSDVQLKLYGFDDYSHGNQKKRKIKNSSRTKNIQSQFDVGEYTDSKIIISDEYSVKYSIDENGILNWINPVCPHCHTNKVKKWSLYSKNVVTEYFCGTIIMRRYMCKKCHKTFITDLEDQFDSHSNISNSLKDKMIEIKELNWDSLRNISKYFEIFYGIKISPETVRKVLIVIEGNEIDYEIPKLSGYYGYDAQWVKINKKWKYRHALYDLVHRMPIAELFAEEETNDDVYYLINKYTEPNNRKAIVTDTKPGYDTVMRDLKFKRHQYCVFHFKYNLNKKIKEDLNKQKRKIKSKLEKQYENKSQTFINDKVEDELKPIKDENKYVLQLLYYVFNEGSFDKALCYVELIKANMVNFPKVIREYVEDVFLPNYKSYLYYLEEPYKGKLDDTNNKIEGYFRATMPKGYKRKFRTFKGLINQIYHRGNGLIRNQKERNKHKKPTRFVR